MRKKIDTDKYEGHVLVDGKWVKHAMSQEEYDATKALIKDAPLLLQEVKWLREDINQIPIDLHESLDMILEAHHPEVRESVMAMFGDAIGNNVVGYEE